MLSNDGTWIALAEVARPHGIRGELRLKLFNRDSSVLEEIDEVLVRLPSGEEHEVSVDHARRADSAILLKLYSVDDRDRAEDLRGAMICVRRSTFPPLEDREFYVCDVIGADVVCDGVRVGAVRDVCTYPSVDTLAVSGDDDTEFEVPLVDAFVASVDVGARAVVLRTLDGVEKIKRKGP